MTSNQNRLARLYAKEHFGDFVEAVVAALLARGRQNLRQLQTRLATAAPTTATAVTTQSEPQLAFKHLKKTRAALKILIQHSMVKVSRHAVRGYIEYEPDLRRILALIKYPQMILSAKEMFGDDAEVVVEELLQKGCLTMVQVVSRVTDRLNVAMEAEGEAPIPYSQVQETFKKLVKCRFLERLPAPDPTWSTGVATVTTATWSQEHRFAIPDISVASIVAARNKRQQDGESEPAAKRRKTESASSSSLTSPDDDIFWRMNEDRFELLFRDRLLVKAVEIRLDRAAAEVLRAMLRLNELSADATSDSSTLLSAAEVFRLLPADLQLTSEVFERHANALAEDRCDFVRKTSETAGGGATYCLQLRTALTNLAQAHVESFIREKYGVKALRVIRMLKAKGQMEQHKIEEAAMMPAKETKDVCYRLFSENILSLTEIPRTTDHAPSRTIYLFHLQFDNLVRSLLDRSYKAVINLKERWHHETSEHGRMLDKQCKVEGIYAKLQQNGAEEDQLREVEEMLSPLERDQLEKVKLYRDKLERSELLLTDTILVLEQYLGMEAFHGARAATPTPKKPAAVHAF